LNKNKKIKKEIPQEESIALNNLSISQAPVEVYTAVELNERMIEKIKKTLDHRTGLDTKIKIIVDKSIIGGLVVKINYSVIDLSIKRKLENLRILLKDLDLRGKKLEADN
jgi:F0F1-type ATP synthase delta subunit